MTDLIYNELGSRGYMVDVGVVETAAGVITPVTDLFNAAKTGGGSVGIKAGDVALSFDSESFSCLRKTPWKNLTWNESASSTKPEDA